MKTTRIAATMVAVVVFAWPSVSLAQSKPPEIVNRATSYVADFVHRFSNVVAEERYMQQEAGNPRRRRELVSDFLLVAAPGTDGWYQFRDVIEVDGKPVRDRDDRLAKLFLAAPSDALARAKEINAESERYSLENIGAMDQPLFAIALLQPMYVTRFRYTVGRVDKDSGPGVRMVGFEEWQHPTIVKQGNGHYDFALHGHVLIDEATGRVLRTELDLSRSFDPPRIITTFKFDDGLQMMVPVDMQDPFGVATYSRFRRFTVQTDEKIR